MYIKVMNKFKSSTSDLLHCQVELVPKLENLQSIDSFGHPMGLVYDSWCYDPNAFGRYSAKIDDWELQELTEIVTLVVLQHSLHGIVQSRCLRFLVSSKDDGSFFIQCTILWSMLADDRPSSLVRCLKIGISGPEVSPKRDQETTSRQFPKYYDNKVGKVDMPNFNWIKKIPAP